MDKGLSDTGNSQFKAPRRPGCRNEQGKGGECESDNREYVVGVL